MTRESIKLDQKDRKIITMIHDNQEIFQEEIAKIGKETEVPFEPDGSRPIYCRECYQKRRPKRIGKR